MRIQGQNGVYELDESTPITQERMDEVSRLDASRAPQHRTIDRTPSLRPNRGTVQGQIPTGPASVGPGLPTDPVHIGGPGPTGMPTSKEPIAPQKKFSDYALFGGGTPAPKKPQAGYESTVFNAVSKSVPRQSWTQRAIQQTAPPKGPKFFHRGDTPPTYQGTPEQNRQAIAKFLAEPDGPDQPGDALPAGPKPDKNSEGTLTEAMAYLDAKNKSNPDWRNKRGQVKQELIKRAREPENEEVKTPLGYNHDAARFAANLQGVKVPLTEQEINQSRVDASAQLIRHKGEAETNEANQKYQEFHSVAEALNAGVGAVGGALADPTGMNPIANQIGSASAEAVAGGLNPISQGEFGAQALMNPGETAYGALSSLNDITRSDATIKERVNGLLAAAGIATGLHAGFEGAFGDAIEGARLNKFSKSMEPAIIEYLSKGGDPDQVASAMGRNGKSIVSKIVKTPEYIESKGNTGKPTASSLTTQGDRFVTKTPKETPPTLAEGPRLVTGNEPKPPIQLPEDLAGKATEPKPEVKTPEVKPEAKPNEPTFWEKKTKPVEEPNTSETPTSSEHPTTETEGLETHRKALEKVREDLGWDQYDKPDVKHMSSLAAEADKKGYIKDAETIADQVLKNPRPLKDAESAGLSIKLQHHLDAMKAAEASGDGEAYDTARDAANKLADALDRSGTEAGRALNAKKLVLKNDYSDFAMDRKAKAAEKSRGKLLTAQEIAATKTKSAKVKQKTDALQVSETKAARARTEKTLSDTPRTDGGKRVLVSDETYAKAKALLAKKPTGNLGPRRGQRGTANIPLDPERFAAHVQTALYHIESGVRAIPELIRRIKSDGPGISDENAIMVAHEATDQASRKYNQGRAFGEDVLVQGKAAIQSSDIASLRKELDSMQAEVRKTKNTPNQGLIKELQGKIKDLDRLKGPNMDLKAYEKLREEIAKISKQLSPGSKDNPNLLRQGSAGVEDPAVAKARLELQQAQYEADQHIANLTPPSVYQRIQRWQHFGIFSGTSILGKLLSATVQSTALDTLGDLFVTPLEKTGLGRKAGDGMSGFNGRAEINATAQFLKGDTWLDVWRKAKTGVNSLDLANKNLAQSPSAQGWFDFFGHIHGALKTPLQRAAYAKAVTKITNAFAKSGKNIGAPEVMAEIATQSYNESLEAIFQNKNKLSTALSHMQSGWENSDNPVAHFLSFVTHILAPVTKTPTNIVGRTLETTFGLPAALGQGAYKGIGQLFGREFTAADAQGILKLAKRGGPGAALFALGYAQPSFIKAGGYYAPGTKAKQGQDPGEQAGHINFNGYELPTWLTHGPLWEPIQLGATFRRAVEGSKNASEAPGNALYQAGYGLMEHTPFLETLTQASGIRDADSAGRFFGNVAEGVVVPGIVQQVARGRDDVPRQPKGFTDELKMGVPGLRETVGAKNDPFGRPLNRNSSSDRVVSEMKALNLDHSKIKKSADETDAQFEARKQQNYDDVKSIITSDAYKKMTRAQKIAAIKADLGMKE